MIVIAAMLLGAGWGARSARQRGGNGMDIAQYAAVGAILGALLGLLATLVLARVL